MFSPLHLHNFLFFLEMFLRFALCITNWIFCTNYSIYSFLYGFYFHYWLLVGKEGLRILQGGRVVFSDLNLGKRLLSQRKMFLLSPLAFKISSSNFLSFKKLFYIVGLLLKGLRGICFKKIGSCHIYFLQCDFLNQQYIFKYLQVHIDLTHSFITAKNSL